MTDARQHQSVVSDEAIKEYIRTELANESQLPVPSTANPIVRSYRSLEALHETLHRQLQDEQARLSRLRVIQDEQHELRALLQDQLESSSSIAITAADLRHVATRYQIDPDLLFHNNDLLGTFLPNDDDKK